MEKSMERSDRSMLERSRSLRSKVGRSSRLRSYAVLKLELGGVVVVMGTLRNSDRLQRSASSSKSLESSSIEVFGSSVFG